MRERNLARLSLAVLLVALLVWTVGAVQAAGQRPANSPPTISSIPSQVIDEDEVLGPLSFTVSDAETPADQLTLFAVSNNETLIPVANVVFGGAGTNRTVTITPAPERSGQAIVTLVVSDGAETAQTSFLVTVNPVDDPPVIQPIPDQTIVEGTSTDPIPITLSDVDTPLNSLTLSATADDTLLVPPGSFAFAGSGGNRTLTVTPAAGVTGSTRIVVTVSDGHGTGTASFNLTVVPANQPPAIEYIPDQQTLEDTSLVVTFQVSDPETPSDNLIYSAESSNQDLVPNGNLILSGTGNNRKLTITPAPNQFGTVGITVRVSDGELTASRTFKLTVIAVDDPPHLADIPSQVTPEDTPLVLIANVTDIDTLPQQMSITATSTNPDLVPNANIQTEIVDQGFRLTITPVANQTGSTVILITVSDGTSITSDSFQVTVTPVNDPPTIVPFGDQTTQEDVPLGPLPFVVQDLESPSEAITVTASSDNLSLVPLENIELSGSGLVRYLTVTPRANRYGKAVITLWAGDGEAVGTYSFVLTVQPVNDRPVMEDIPDQVTDEDTPLTVLFMAYDEELTPAQLTYSASSADEALLPSQEVRFSLAHNGTRMTLTPGPDLYGTVLLTVTVSDGDLSVSDNFFLTVNPVNDPPTFSRIFNQSIAEGQTITVPFTVDDVDSAQHDIQVSATSSNQELVPDENLALLRDGNQWSLVVEPAPGAYGNTTITLTADDGVDAATTTFQITTNAYPILSPIQDQTLAEDEVRTVDFTVDDPDTPLSALRFEFESTNPAVIPLSGLRVGGNGNNRTLTITPAPAASGVSTVTLRVNDGLLTASTTFRVTVTGQNDPPRIGSIKDRLMDQDTSITVEVTVTDEDSDLSVVSLWGTSSDPSIVPNENIVADGQGDRRTVTITPAPGKSGVVTIHLTASDGEATGHQSFTLTINGRPYVVDPGVLTLPEDSQESFHIAIGDPDTEEQRLVLQARSGDSTIIPDTEIRLEGQGLERTLILTPLPNRFGTLTVTLTVFDGRISGSRDVPVHVTPVNDPPTLEPLEPITTQEDTPVGPIPITVNDIDTPLAGLALFANPVDRDLVPLTHVAFGGQGANREVTITPAKDLYGSTFITVTVSDGLLHASTGFTLTVLPVNDAPVIDPIPDQQVPEDGQITVPFTVWDVDDPADGLAVSARSSDTRLLPDTGIRLEGTGRDRRLVLTPRADQVGSVQVTVVAGDGRLTTERSFTLYVGAVNDGPVLAPIPDGVVAEDEVLLVPLQITDIDTPGDQLTLRATSGDIGVVPDENLWFTGEGFQRTLHLKSAPNRNGVAAITVEVSDGEWTASRTFQVTVEPVNDAPTARDDRFRIVAQGTVNLPVMANDYDVDYDPLRVVAVSQGQHGAVSINSDNTVRYMMPPGLIATDVFSYTVSDGRGGLDVAVVTVEMVPPAGPDTPQIQEVIPAQGDNDRSRRITLRGRGFRPGATITLGPYPLPDVRVPDSTTIQATVPAFLPPQRYDLVVRNPDGVVAVRTSGYRVTTTGVAVTEVRPAFGQVGLPVTLNVYGVNFGPQSQVLVDERPAETTYIGPGHLQAHLPRDFLAPGPKPVTVRNPDGSQATLADAYTAYAATDDDLLARPYELWTEPAILRVGQSAQIGLRVHRQGGERLWLDVPVAFYHGEPGMDTFIGRTVVARLDPNGDGATLPVVWTPPAPGVYTLFARIDPDGRFPESQEDNNQIFRTVIVLPTQADFQPPQVLDLVLNGGQETTTQRPISVTVDATDVGSQVAAVTFVEYEYVRASDRWIPVQWSEWLTYTAGATYAWTLLPAPGRHYLRAWAVDAQGNIAGVSRLAGINYAPAGDDALLQDEVRLFRYRLRVGDHLSAFVLPRRGDPDIYVWPPDHTTRGPWITNLRDEVDEIGVVAPVEGEYQVEMVGFSDTVYQWVVELRPGGPRLKPADSSNLDATKPLRAEPFIPVDRVPFPAYGLPSGPPQDMEEAPPAEEPSDPPVSTPEPTPAPTHRLYLPAIQAGAGPAQGRAVPATSAFLSSRLFLPWVHTGR